MMVGGKRHYVLCSFYDVKQNVEFEVISFSSFWTLVSSLLEGQNFLMYFTKNRNYTCTLGFVQALVPCLSVGGKPKRRVAKLKDT